MIGIIGAMTVEIDKIAEEISNKNIITISGVKFISGIIGKVDVVVAVCGVGKVYAAVCAQTMIIEYNPEVIINIGVAGGIAESLKIGNIAIASNVVQHDMDTSPLGDPVGMISGIDKIYIPCDKKLCEKVLETVKKVGIKAVIGTIASGDQFISDKLKKKYLQKTFSAIACEMEGAAIGHVCYINDVPFVVIRAISDIADESSKTDFMEFVNIAAENSAKVIKEFIGEME